MSPDSRQVPPRLAEGVLSAVLPDGEVGEGVLGDLHELFLERARDPSRGPGAARRWYWLQSVRLSVSYAVRRARFRRGLHGKGDGMGSWLRQFRFSLRSLIRSPGFSVPALLILAVGLTAATTMFTVIDAIIFRPLDYPESERIVLVCENHARMGDACVASPGNAADFRAHASSFSAMGIGRGWAFSLTDAEGRSGLRGGLATGGFFEALGVVPAIGRLFAEDEFGPDRDDVLILSHGFWQDRFGADPAVLGASVTVDGEPAVVVGVLPRGFEAPLDLVGIEAWRPPHFDLLDPEFRGWRGWRTVARLAPGVSTETGLQELEGLYRGLSEVHSEIDDEWRVGLRPLIDAVVGDTRPVFFVFLAAAGLLMVIVCANVANLLLARGMERRRELAVRVALGAGRRRLVLDILGESLVLTALAALVALGLAEGSTRLLITLAPPEVPRLDEVGFDVRVAAFAGLIAIVTTGVFSLLPALRVTAIDLAKTMRSGDGNEGGRLSNRLRDGLIVAELAFCVVLVASAALLTRSLSGYLAWHPGFERAGLVAVSAFVPPEKYGTSAELIPLMRAAEARLSAVPGISAVTSASAGPLFGGGDGGIRILPEGWTGSAELPSAAWFDVGPGYFQTLGLEVRQGREFVEADELGSAAVAVVNEALVRRAWPDGRAVGRTLLVPDRDLSLEIVGVVADVPPLVPGQQAQPEIYWPNRQMGRWGTYFVVRAEADPSAVSASLAKAILEVDPDLSLGTPRTLASLEERALVRPRFQALVLLTFALAALLLAAGGVYAVVSYAVERRVREVGIRVALGAGSVDVVSMIVRSVMGPVVAGVSLGLALTLSTGSLWEGVLHGVGTGDPISMVAAAALLLFVAVAAAFVPAVRASRGDPLRAIKAD